MVKVTEEIQLFDAHYFSLENHVNWLFCANLFIFILIWEVTICQARQHSAEATDTYEKRFSLIFWFISLIIVFLGFINSFFVLWMNLSLNTFFVEETFATKNLHCKHTFMHSVALAV